MAQTGYTPIQLYYSSTTSNVPLATDLANGELAINITDGKLFYKDNSAAVQVIGWKTTPTSAGGTGLTSYTAGDMVYYASGTALSKLAIGTTDYVMTSSGTAPQWSASLKAKAGGTGQTSYAVGDLLYADTTTTLAKLADVATGNALISGGVSTAPSWGKIGLTTHVSGTLPTANGGTNLTSFTANGLVYASSTSALATSSNLTWDGTTFINAAGPIQARAGAYSSFYCTNQDGAYPSNYINTAGGDNQISFASNWYSGQRDLSIINSNIAGNGFGFYQMTGASAKTRLAFTNTGTFEPGVDNTMTLGSASYRWTTVYATTALINTSDVNDKQQIEDLTSAEIAVAKKLKDLFKSYKFNSAVAEKGDNARIHVGLMAQDVQQAFIDEGLDPNKYALFCSDTWQEYNGQAVLVDDKNMYSVVTGYELDGQTFTLNEGNVAPKNSTPIFTKMPTQTVTKLGLRYTEVMAFLMAAVAQELNSLTARVAALELK